ncbi:KRRI-Interacting protein 1 [Physocladia obscura]|uniref:KRRI-Interacting protein 1 n=1 Tax=Physocladia obscura TaxID=109957 RepID=A0AAD5T7L8_9FUNG|nr:KRRI-Interacting protein 1 [Physocladia obscura]
MKFKSKSKKEQADDDANNPNLIPVKSRGNTSQVDIETVVNEDEFETMASVEPSDILTIDLSNDSNDDEAELKINKLFASKYDEKKKAEEISLLRDKYGDDYEEGSENETDSESEEEEDENGELLTKELDVQILKTIGLIRAKRPEVYDPKRKFFSEEELEKSKNEWEEKQNIKKAEGKKVTLKDYHRQRLLEGTMDDQDDENDNASEIPIPQTYFEEQEDIRRSFKEAFNSADNNDDDGSDDGDLLVSMESKQKGGLFSIRQKNQAELDVEEADYKTFLLQNVRKEGDDLMIELTGKEADQSEKFLMDFILNKGWIDPDADENAIPTYEQIVKDEHLDEDEADEEEVDRFEQQYNFRYEEGGGDSIVTHSRNIEDSMRRKDTRRSEQRAARKARKAEEKLAKEEELKRLKNLKKEEMREKLLKIAEIAGTNTDVFNDLDLNEDFDPSKFDEMMAARFNDKYYESGENQNGEQKKPVFNDEALFDFENDLVDDEENELSPPPLTGLVDEKDFEIDNLVDSILKPKAGEGKVFKINRRLDRLTLLEEKEKQERIAELETKESKKRKRNGEEIEPEDYNEDEDFVMDADYLPGGELYGEEAGTKKKNKRDKKKEIQEKKKELLKSNNSNKTLDEYIDEYLQLDFEDTIGDLQTRFKYRKVDNDDYGLPVEDILQAPETALNELVPLKHLAPFRPEARKIRDKEIW